MKSIESAKRALRGTAVGGVFLSAAFVTPAYAQEVGRAEPLPKTPTTAPVQLNPDGTLPLGTRYSASADITFLTPPGCTEIRRVLSSGEFVRYFSEAKKWVFVAVKADLEKPVPLKDYRDKGNDPRDPQGGGMRKGYLTLCIEQLKADSPDAHLVREPEVFDFGTMKVGVFSARMNIDGKPVLMQQALVQVSEQRYYALTFRSPAEKENPEEDPAVLEAVSVFGGIVDSIELLDLKAIREEQNRRIFASGASFYNWNSKTVGEVLVPEQWLRFVQDGKDIGYAYVIEEPADALPVKIKDETAAAKANRERVSDNPKGFRVGMRSRTVTKEGTAVNAESWTFVTFDRSHEVWSNLVVTHNPLQKDPRQQESWFTEVGASDKQIFKDFDTKPDARGRLSVGDKEDPQNPTFRTVETYKMVVRAESKSAVAKPVDLTLSPFYLPQAMSQILPRLLPLREPKGYLFTTYLSDRQMEALRYVDVMPETSVALGGKQQRVIPVVDRLGRDGSKKIYYMSPNGKFLGLIDEGSNTQMLPTDAATLEKIWKADLNLSRPADAKQ